ncbi:hypothetical protein AYI70_g1792 [Smittium culicis]|uniref:Uncharacterized protein n=1 Tax=Smittium culicis TaxID=133412 RepID=A0A1R1YB87_9FUNG|nr:hypothetical protein AYI70_g1792 [Smittium culicis]
MPLLDENNSHGGYNTVLKTVFSHVFDKKVPGDCGHLAVIYDKNVMEASGYATALADMAKETVYLVPYYKDEPNDHIKWVMQEKDLNGEAGEVRHAEAVEQDPDQVEDEGAEPDSVVPSRWAQQNDGRDRFPETINNVAKSEIPLWLKSMGNVGVLKVPYSNAGQGVYTITSSKQLESFMNTRHHYDKFIVQSLVGNSNWSSRTKGESFYHVGTIPDKKDNTYVCDIRMMVAGSDNGFVPVCIYSRKARKPLVSVLDDHSSINSWEILGTNLSVKLADNSWTTEPARLALMDHKDFNKLGLGIDDLIDCYIQTVLSTIAIDKMCKKLINDDNSFNAKLFADLNPDDSLLDEIKK